ncbi:cytochrome B5 [Geobacillus sp. NFOSA3]|uniref:Cytochrome aa3 subunit 2 n=2 Tax=Parageobacillus toebii TaxID=153151 RepID=A0A6G9J6J1_9BACL|nr:cytochrome c oxidase subunit II [Parageobacillus toebii]NNU94273.1 cytochrome B5 [Geobacillus sp. NFOSA3]OQP00365.1 cytochrome B5 [Geobacillus sp. 44C]MBB3869962.1 cytochrome c oxidase subunit 2 [Parageobacillus toebii NBRC 107807]MED4970110.1 cytochrome c oxidase subunit II [Parageobacillus toebii]MED4990720.1 cytochrome c oxidase subunit II [Parageobacillus toebii]
MHMHKYEKIWLVFGIGVLFAFLVIVGVSAFAEGQQPPSCLTTIDPEKVDQTPPFDKPGLVKTGDNEYQLNIVVHAFAFTPNQIEIPKGAKVTINVTTKDVIHGFQVPGTNINMMVEPGYINTLTHTFNKPGEYTILCNEYCGAGHHMMTGRIKVVEK